MMKSAVPYPISQRVRVRCERIYAWMRHFPSELARSRQTLGVSRIAEHGMTPLYVKQSVGFVLRKVKMRVVPRKS